MPSDLFSVRPRWIVVARAVSERLGKTYSASYVQQVSSGVRTNNRVAPVLQELGVMAAKPDEKPAKSRRKIAA